MLTVGSGLRGDDSLEGELDEVYCFARPLLLGFHYTPYKAAAALGPISAEEMAYREELRAKLKAERAKSLPLSADSLQPEDGGGMMLRMAGPANDCVTNGTVYLTNVVCNFTTNEGWTLYFDIMGGTNEVVYDLFSTPELKGSNTVWTWLETALTCETHIFTNQATNQMFYTILTPGTDRDGDGLYDGWEWKHFGTLAQTATSDYDNDGVSDLIEYQYDTDPNSIDFIARFGYRHFNSSQATVQPEMFLGLPAFAAVLVNNTNYSQATWLPYNGTIPFTLGNTDGVYSVEIGLRGRVSTSPILWQQTFVTLDRAPPLVAITNPTTATISKSIVQLKGYCPESLKELTCTVSNAAVVITNINAFYFANNPDDKCLFEWPNLGVTNGLNVFTVRATDWAGNLTISNFSFTVDYAADTNPPIILVKWPQNGSAISDTSFTLRGRVDDEMTKVTAQIVNAAGQTNDLIGIVELDGMVWVQNLPLSAGTNLLKLTAVDASGNTAVTNLHVTKSPIILTMDPIPEGYLNNLYVTVTGTINTNGYRVWVNGVSAIPDTNGYWQINYVPIPPGGTAVFETIAIPLIENDGYGTWGGAGGGGGGGSGGGSNNSPGGTNQPPARAPENDKPHTVTLVEGEWQSYGLDLSLLNGLYYSTDFQWNWNETNGGYGDYTSAEPAGIAVYFGGLREWDDVKGNKRSESWADVPSNIIGTNAVFFTDWFGQEFTFKGPKAQGNLSYVDFVGEGVYYVKRKAKTKMLLRTGGKSGATKTNLFLATAWAHDVTRSNVVAVPNTNITIPTFGQLGVSGYVGAMLPDNKEYQITPATSAPYFRYDVGVSKHAFTSTCVSPTPTNRNRLELGVGEHTQLAFTPTLPFGTFWFATGGSVSPAYPTPGGSSATFTARSNAGPASVKVSLPGVAPSFNYNVVEPSGVANATIVSTQKSPPIGTNIAGAYMRLNVTIGPTNVSFYRVQMLEIGRDATNVTSYFTNHWPASHSVSGADVWHPIGYDNLIGGGMDNCSYWGNVVPSPWSPGGGFTWPIPAIWKVGSGSTNALPWSDQVFSLSANGTMMITKFGKTVTRTINEVRTPNLP